jgi:YggT family protein
MSSTLTIILDFVFRLAALLFLFRFLLQASGADFYNPISQAVVKATDTVCKPLRLLLKPLRNFDFASFFVAWLISLLSVIAFTYMQYNSAPAILPALWAGLIKTLLVLMQFYKWTIIIMVIASFVAQGSYHPALALLNQLVEPIMAPVRKVLPSLGPLDLSPMVVLLAIILIEDILMRSYF